MAEPDPDDEVGEEEGELDAAGAEAAAGESFVVVEADTGDVELFFAFPPSRESVR